MHFHKKYISVNKKTPLPYDPTFYKMTGILMPRRLVSGSMD